jgi:hypothetical protein
MIFLDRHYRTRHCADFVEAADEGEGAVTGAVAGEIEATEAPHGTGELADAAQCKVEGTD